MQLTHKKTAKSQTPNKIKALIKTHWLQLSIWILTSILLVITIILLVIWQGSVFATSSPNTLSSQALMQQNTIAAFAFSFVICLTSAIFTTVILAYRKKQHQGGKK